MDELKGALHRIREKAVMMAKSDTYPVFVLKQAGLEALSDIDLILKAVPDLKAALRNAVKPNYDIHVLCPSCDKQVTTDNGEWLLWCGEEKHAQALLDAAQLLANIVENTR